MVYRCSDHSSDTGQTDLADAACSDLVDSSMKYTSIGGASPLTVMT
jgi:hypothetical protein